MRIRKKSKKGFTLIELLIVVAIIGIIAAIAIPNLLVAMHKGKQKATMGDLKLLGTSIESYITDWSFTPQVAEGPITNLYQNFFTSFYSKNQIIMDSWGSYFLYRRGTIQNADQDIYSLISYGRDKAPSAIPAPPLYECTALSDFNNDIYYSGGNFSVGPVTKR